jgi:hypothetical protein
VSVTPSDLLADLPDPRDDEPASLRSDIAEELTDHLVCSVRREMVKGADEPTAWERALKRFGDPRQIARKLWWLAMRRRIMNQRLMLGLQGAMLLAVIAVAAAMIQMSNAQQRQMAQQQEVLTTALAKLSERLDSQVSGAAAVNRVQVRVVEGKADGPVIKTAKVTLAQPAWEKPLEPAVADDGVLDFGYLDAGVYTLTTRLTWWGLEESRRFVVHPGKDHMETVVAPPPPQRGFDVKVVIPLNARLREAKTTANFLPQLERCAEPFEKWVPHGVTLGVDNGIPPDVNWFGGTVSEWQGDSLTMTLKLCPGTYSPSIHFFKLFEPLPAPDRLRLLAPRPAPGRPVARIEEAPPSFTVKEAGREWRIDLPTDLVGEAVDALTTAEPASK